MTVVKPVPLLNAANVLTVARMVLVPVFVVFVVAGRMTDTAWQIAAGLTFVVASATLPNEVTRLCVRAIHPSM